MLPDVWAGKKLVHLDGGDRFRIVAVTRAGSPRLSTADLVGQEGDVFHLAVRTDALGELEAALAAGPEDHR